MTVKPRLKAATKPVVFVMMGGDSPLADELLAELAASGVPFFRSPERAMRAIKHLSDYGQGIDPAHDTRAPPLLPRLAPGPQGDSLLAEYPGKSWLAELGLAVPAGGPARSLTDALDTAHRIGYPVVLKAQAA